MAVESPFCLHDQKLKRLPGTFTVVQCLRTTHCSGKPIKVIQNCDQSITDQCRWRRKRRRGGQNLWDFSAHPNPSHMRTQTVTNKQNTFCSQWKINVTPTTSHIEKHSLCSGMNKALHTWNFLGHHATLHYHCNPLRELYPVFSLCQAQIVPKTGMPSLKHQTEDGWKLHKHAHTHSANNSVERQRQEEKICSVGKIKHLLLTGLEL